MQFQITKQVNVPDVIKKGQSFSLNVKFNDRELEDNKKFESPHEGQYFQLFDQQTIVKLISFRNIQRMDYAFTLEVVSKKMDNELLKSGMYLHLLPTSGNFSFVNHMTQ